MEAFIGLTVRVTLRDPSTTLEGIVLSLSAEQGSIELSPVLVRRNGGAQQVSCLIIQRADIAALEVISLSTPTAPTPIAPISQPTNSQHQANQGMVEQTVKGVLNVNAAELNAGEKKPKQRSKKKGKESVVALSEYVPEPPASHDPFPEEFNFSAGLLSFNKSAIFAQIQAADSTDPSLRLHSHNRNPTLAQRGQEKLLSSENVLSTEEAGEQVLTEVLVSQRREEAIAELAEVPLVVVAPNGATARTKRGRKAKFVNADGVRIVQVRLKQYREILSIVDIETGPNALQRTENSARSLASYLLSLLLPPSSLSPPPSSLNSGSGTKKSICILCGSDAEKGIMGLKTGGHLLNRGIAVKVYVLPPSSSSSSSSSAFLSTSNGGNGSTSNGGNGSFSNKSKERDEIEGFSIALRTFSAGGGRVIRDLEDLSELEPTEFDFILDAIADPEILPTNSSHSPSPSANGATLARGAGGAGGAGGVGGKGGEGSFELVEVVRWANEGKVVSVDSACGTDHDTGLPLSVEWIIPSILVCRGALRPSIHSLSSSEIAPLSNSSQDRNTNSSAQDRITNSSAQDRNTTPSTQDRNTTSSAQDRNTPTTTTAKGKAIVLLDSGFFPSIWSRVGLDNGSGMFGREFWSICSAE